MARINNASIALLLVLTISSYVNSVPVMGKETNSEISDPRTSDVVTLDNVNSDNLYVPNWIKDSAIIHKIVKRNPQRTGAVLTALNCPNGEHKFGHICVPNDDNETPPPEDEE